MTIRECYAILGGDYQDAMSRLMKEERVTKYLLKFPSDPSMQVLRDAVKEKNRKDSFSAAHTLKGLAANLGFTALQKAASDLTEQLRSQQEDPDMSLFAAVESAYDNVISAIGVFQASNI